MFNVDNKPTFIYLSTKIDIPFSIWAQQSSNNISIYAHFQSFFNLIIRNIPHFGIFLSYFHFWIVQIDQTYGLHEIVLNPRGDSMLHTD